MRFDEVRGNVVADVDCVKIWLVLPKGVRSTIKEDMVGLITEQADDNLLAGTRDKGTTKRIGHYFSVNIQHIVEKVVQTPYLSHQLAQLDPVYIINTVNKQVTVKADPDF